MHDLRVQPSTAVVGRVWYFERGDAALEEFSIPCNSPQKARIVSIAVSLLNRDVEQSGPKQFERRFLRLRTIVPEQALLE